MRQLADSASEAADSAVAGIPVSSDLSQLSDKGQFVQTQEGVICVKKKALYYAGIGSVERRRASRKSL